MAGGSIIGQRLGNLWRNFAGYSSFLAYALSHVRALAIAPVRTVFQRQLYFTGIEGVGLVALLALLSGALVVTQTTSVVGANSELTVKMLVWAVVGELGPLLAAIIVIARSSVAVATELAIMETRNETRALAAMHIAPMDYLVVPRVCALTLSLVVLTVYFQAIAVAGGLALSALFQNVSFLAQLGRFLDVISLLDIAVAFAKSVCFGLAVAAISCFHGLSAGRTFNAVPVAATRAVIQSLLFIFVIDALIGYLRYVVL